MIAKAHSVYGDEPGPLAPINGWRLARRMREAGQPLKQTAILLPNEDVLGLHIVDGTGVLILAVDRSHGMDRSAVIAGAFAMLVQWIAFVVGLKVRVAVLAVHFLDRAFHAAIEANATAALTKIGLGGDVHHAAPLFATERERHVELVADFQEGWTAPAASGGTSVTRFSL